MRRRKDLSVNIGQICMLERGIYNFIRINLGVNRVNIIDI